MARNPATPTDNPGEPERFWTDYLAGVSGAAANGIDLGPRSGDGAPVRERSVLSEELSSSLLGLADDEADLSAVALCLWAILLCRYSNERDVLFGYVADIPACRGRSLTPVPVRICLGREDSGSHWLSWARETLSSLQQLDHIAPDRLAALFDADLATLPLSSAVVGSGIQDTATAFAKLAHERLLGASEPALALSLSATTSGVIEVAIDFERAPPPGTASRMLRHCQELLKELAGNAEEPVGQWRLLPDDERNLVVDAWNDTVVPFDRGFVLHADIERQAVITPDAPALSFRRTTVSYSELNERANRLAQYLTAKGVQRESLVGVCLERSVDMVVSLLAILKAGCAYVPLDPGYPAERLSGMIEDADLALLVSAEKHCDLLGGGGRELILLDQCRAAIEACAGTNPAIDTSPDSLAYVIFTSGSTGRPKGAMNTHRAICNRLYWMQAEYSLTPEDTVLQKTPFSFDVSVWEFFWPLMIGAKLVVAKPDGHKDRTYLADLIVEEAVTTLHFVPSMLQQFLEEPNVGRCSRTLERVICSGEALPYALKEEFFDKVDAELHNLYGPTEAAVDVTYWACRRDSSRSGVPIGRPVANTKILILDEALEPVPIGVAGELHIGGVQVARGYVNRPELTAEKFISDPFSDDPDARLYKTGDLARFRTNGEIEYLGRLDNQVKIRGLRIELGEIEAGLESHAAVKESVVVVREDGPADQSIVAYLVPRRDYEARVDESDDRVDQVQTIFDQTYHQDAASADPTFNIIGWNSSYTGEPIPASEMRVWVESTVDRILAFDPRRVLEVGCGTGMLLFRIAPACERYVGADFSHVALQRLGELLEQPEYRLENVELMQRPADDFDGLAPQSFDTVIINSVAQLFPSVDYLLDVLGKSVDSLEDGGRIFVGDVRSLQHLEAYHASVELYRGRDEMRCQEFLDRIGQRASLEEELLIDPSFFYALKKHNPRITAVKLELKRGSFHNELTRFRYDVTITVGGEAKEAVAPLCVDWRGADASLERLAGLLGEEGPDAVHVRHVLNARLEREWVALELSRDGGLRDLSALKESVDARAGCGVEPEAVWELGQRLGYDVQIRWTDPTNWSHFDALFVRRGVAEYYRLEPFPNSSQDWSVYANDPLRGIQARHLVPELRSHLKERLPDFMVPAAFVVLEGLPLSPNGKIDRKALPAPDYGRPDVQDDYVAPTTDIERALCEVWCEVLGLSRVGVNDNFFDVGGDSILNIQIVSRAAKAGIRLTPLQLFKHQTISELAQAAESQVVVRPQQEPSTGAQFLSPMQRWVIEKAPKRLEHSNQLALFHSKRALDTDILRRATQHLLEQHDALRLQFSREDSGAGWRAEYGNPNASDAFDVIRLEGGESETAFLQQLDAKVAEVSAGTSLDEGVLWKVVHFECADRGDRVLFCLHHLVGDGFSMRILTEDFAAAYLDIERNGAPTVVEKSSSFQLAGERMAAHADSTQLTDELDYWSRVTGSAHGELPFDAAEAEDDERSETSFVTAVSAETSLSLLQNAINAHRVRMNELLIAALARTLSRWIGSRNVLIETESHGREAIFDDLDLSRTVGVFSTMFPLSVDVGERSAAETLAGVKNEFRSMPRNGLGYGFLCFPVEDEAGREFRERLNAQVLFNYLGHFDQAGALRELFHDGHELDTSDRAAGEIRTHALDVVAMISGGELSIKWTYSQNRFSERTVAQLAESFTAELESLAASHGDLETSSPLPADFPLVSLSEPELERIVALTDGIENVYPLTPLQEGMLFHALYEPESDVYYVQLNGRLSPEFDLEAFVTAWNTVADRHGIFRTRFVVEGLSKPVQVVAKRSPLPFSVDDLRGKGQEFVEAHLQEAREDRRFGYTVAGSPLTSVRVVIADDAHYLFWNFHHLLLDGASVLKTVEQVFDEYDRVRRDGAATASRADPQFSDFVAWLGGQAMDDAEAFWRSRLGSFSVATRLPIDRRADGEKDSPLQPEKLRFRLTSEAGAQFLEAARRRRLTPNSVVHGAWALLLASATNTDDVVFGSVVPGRPPALAGAADIVGLCMNTLPVRIDLNAGGTVEAWLEAIQAKLVEAREFDFSPLVEVQKWSGVAPGKPLFESVIAVQGYLGRHASLEEWAESIGIENLEFIDWNSLPLSLAVEVGNTLDVVLKYSTTVMSPEDAAVIARRLEHLLVALPTAMDRTLEEFLTDLVTEQRNLDASQEARRRGSSVSRLRKTRRKTIR